MIRNVGHLVELAAEKTRIHYRYCGHDSLLHRESNTVTGTRDENPGGPKQLSAIE